MTTTIAIAGKGGTGKTTLAALLIDLLSGKGAVLAIDADPSSNLNLALGLPLHNTVGSVREEMLAEVKRGAFPPAISKQDWLGLRIQESLVESSGVDLLAMGRPEGPGCYCAANNMIRMVLDRIETNYDFVVVDNEAGMEHISRQTTRDVDILLVVTDTTVRGVITAARMKELIQEIRTSVGRIALVVNRLQGELSPEVEKVIAENGLEVVGFLPEDPAVTVLDRQGSPIRELPLDSPLRLAVKDITEKLGLV